MGATIGALALSLTACSMASGPRFTTGKSTSTSAASESTTTPQPPTSRTAALSVSSTTLEAGQPVTVSGNHCPEGDWASASLVLANPGSDPAIFDTYLSTGGSSIETVLASNGATRVTAAPDATWTIHAMVPMVFPGPSVISARCRPPTPAAAPSAGFLYPLRDVSVNTPYTLSVAPGTTVMAGSTLTVQPNGGGCGSIAASPIVALYQTTGTTTQVVANTSGESHPGTYWQASLVVPPELKPGHYQLEADCDYSRGAIYGSYAPLQIIVG